MLDTKILNDDLVSLPTTLIRRKLGQHEYALNIAGHSGFVILSGMALDVINACATPCSFGKLQTQLPWASQDGKLDQVVKRLSELEMVRVKPELDQEVRGNLIKGHTSRFDVWLQTTDACNLRCKYCFVSKSPAVMSLETAKAVIMKICQDTLEAGYDEVRFKLAGGEPTLRWDMIRELLKWVDKVGHPVTGRVRFGILTNGTNLNDELLDYALQGKISISISMDAVGDAHDRQRPFRNGKGSFARIDNNIDRLTQAGVRVGILTVVTHNNYDKLIQIVSYAFERNHFIRTGIYREGPQTAPDLRVTNEELVQGFGDLLGWMKNNLPNFSLYSGYKFGDVDFKQPKTRGCGAGKSGAAVNHDGTFSYCPSSMNNSLGRLEGINSVLAINENSPMEFSDGSVDKTEGCSVCEWRYICGNGCTLTNKYQYGTPNRKAPECSLFRFALPILSDLHVLQILKKQGLEV